MLTLRLTTPILFTLLGLNTLTAQGAIGALRNMIASEARILSSTSAINRIGEGAGIYSSTATNTIRGLGYMDRMYADMGNNSILLRELPQNTWSTVHLDKQQLFTITRNHRGNHMFNEFFRDEYLKKLFDQTATHVKRGKLDKADSILLAMAILDFVPEILNQYQLSSSGGQGIIPPRYPFVYGSFEDYRRMKHTEDSWHEEKEHPDTPDEPEETDPDVQEDSTADEHQKTEGNRKTIIYPARESIPPSPSGIHWVRWAGLLLYWILSSLGISRIFLKAKVSRSTAFIPFWRLGQLFHVCGYQHRHAFSLLVPVFNIYYWWQVNNRLCKSFQYPSSLAVLGFLLPGFLWFLIGYSNKYYVGSQRF